ncbi:DUF551 domain-containing protein [Escherichia coli]|nr:DUF551 domain-containing protein [Escherichia coli]EIP0356220.1 DUF551 domain-containing protein [Escherichia coli]EIV1208685.1 DUF551 domain-containing protein [Escherichia coli]EJH9368861.1 DUF551 domain-containing protein [Escherichia coli]EKC8316411.1 DUF551 domain-containing protein [Escherichia coli]
MTTITKERLLTIRQWRETYGPGSNVVLPAEEAEELARIALAALEVEPIGFRCRRNDNLGDWSYVYHREPDDFERKHLVIEGIYAAPPVPVVPEEKPMPNPLKMYAVDAVAAIAEVRGRNACRAAMLQGGQPVNQTYNLPELIEGMEVSIDVSTCDADLGNRYFGTVTEALELDTAKNGYILLVQDAEPNFDVNGNSPGTPDSWISCSERMPDDGQHVIILCDGAFVLYAQYRDGEFFDIVRNGDEFFETQSRNVTDWMRLPEPPKEVNRG